MTNAVRNSSLFSLFFINSSWNFHSSRYHPFLFHPDHVHEMVPHANEHVLDPHPWDSGNEYMTAVEYGLYD
jgi:hypothetical protein